MADMYLTKKERATIYTEATIYILLVLVSCYLTIYGSIFVKMIPMLFILGVIARLVFDRPITTSFFGAIAVFCIGFVITRQVTLDIVILTIYSGVMITCGEQLGNITRKLYYAHKLRTFIPYYKRVILIVAGVLLLVFPTILNSVINSNPIAYLKAKSKTEKHIQETYGVSNYKIEEVSYNVRYRGGYIFDIKISEETVRLIHKGKNYIEDSNISERQDKYNSNLNEKLSSKYNLDGDNTVIKGEYQFSKISVKPDTIVIIINADIDKSNAQDMKKLVSYINSIKELEEYPMIKSIELSIGNKGISIKKEMLDQGIDSKYIEKGLENEIMELD